VEQAKVHLDNKEYKEAIEILDKMAEDQKQDSNEVRLLLAAANLGVSGLDIWSIIGSVLEESSSGGGGIQTS
jgi:hypothetical protein